MKRTLALLLGAAMITLAAFQPEPMPVGPADASPVGRPEGLTDYSFCPQWRTDGAFESQLWAMPEANSRVNVDWWNGNSFSVALTGEVVGSVSSDLRQGVVPVMLESNRPVPFGVRSTGALGRSSSACASWPDSAWVVGVGGSLEGETTTFVIMNPFPQAVTVGVQVYSEQGLEVVESLEDFSVPAGESREVNLSERLRLRTHLVVIVDDPKLATFSAIFFHRDGATGTAIGKSLAEQWYFPAPPNGTVGEVVVVNPSAVPVTVDLDLFEESGSTLSVEQITLDRRSSVILPVPAGAAVQVRADGEVGASMRASSATTVGIMTGIPTPALSWVLPGASREEELIGLSVINPGPTPATAGYRFVGAGGRSVVSPFTVPSGASVYLEVRARDSLGMVVESDVPIIVGWSTVGEELDLILDGGVAR